MPDRLRLAAAVCVAAMGVAAGVLWWPGPAFAGVALAYVVAQLVPMPTPSGAGVSMAPAVAGAAALVSEGSPVLVLATGAAAMPLSLLVVHLLHGRRVRDERFPAEPIGVVVFGSGFALAELVLRGAGSTVPITLVAYTLAAAAGYVATSVARATISARGRLPRRLRVVRAMADWPAHAVLYAAAALYAVTIPTMGWWAWLLAGLPCGFGWLSLRRLQETRRTYHQTIRALGRIPEAGGMVEAGHTERTTDLALAAGGVLGFGWRELDRVESAALLHDIGRLVLANPAVAAVHHTPSDVAAWSAAIIGEVPHLEPVATLVGAMHQPYRRPGQPRDPELAREAHLIRVVSAYDEEIASGHSPVEAMETLHRGAAYDFDPDMVAALRLVLERRGVLAA